MPWPPASYLPVLPCEDGWRLQERRCSRCDTLYHGPSLTRRENYGIRDPPPPPRHPQVVATERPCSCTVAANHPKGLSITTQFGTLKGDLATPVFLFTPTSKSLVPPPPPPLAPDALRHFQRYRLANVSGAPKTTGIHLSDQLTRSFGGSTADLDPALRAGGQERRGPRRPRRPAGHAVLHDAERSPAVQPVHRLRDEPVLAASSSTARNSMNSASRRRSRRSRRTAAACGFGAGE